MSQPCPYCEGRGTVDDSLVICNVCEGTGVVTSGLAVCDHDDCPPQRCVKRLFTRAEWLCFWVYAIFGGSVAAYMIGKMLYRLWRDVK